MKSQEKDGLIKREIFHERPVRIEYSLTEKGEALHPVLDEMASYSTEHCAKDVFKDGKARKLEDVYGNEVSP